MNSRPYSLVVLAFLLFLSSFASPSAHGQDLKPMNREPSIEEFLAGENASEFGWSTIDRHLDSLLQTSFAEGDQETPKRVFKHYVYLYEKARKEGIRSFNTMGNASFATDFLRTINGHSSNARARLAFTLEVLRDLIDQQQVEVPDHFIWRLLSPMVEKYRRDTANVSGEAARLRVFEEYFQFLSHATGGRLCSIAGPELSNLFTDVGAREIGKIVDWLESDGTGPLAKDLAMAARLRRAIQEESDRPTELSTEQRYYLSVLNNRTLPITWRLETARGLVAVLGERLHPDLIMKAGLLLIEGWRSPHVKIPSHQAQELLSAYLDVADMEVDAWRDQGREIADAWLHDRKAEAEGAGARTPEGEMVELLKLCFFTEKQEVLEGIPSEDLVSYWPTGQVYFLLFIRHGAIDHANDLIKRWEFFTPLDAEKSAYYDDAIRDNFGAFLERIEQEDVRYFGEIVLKSLPDPESIDEGSPTRSERLKKLAEGLENITFTDPALKAKAMSFLALEPSTANALEPHFVELTRNINIDAIPMMNDSDDSRARLSILSGHIRNSVARKDPDLFIDYLDQLMRAEVEHDGQLKQPLWYLGHSFLGGIADSWGDWTEEDMAKFVPAAETLYGIPSSPLSYLHIMSQEIGFNQALVLFLTSGNLGAFDDLYERSDEDNRNAMKRSTHTLRPLLGSLATTYAGSPGTDPLLRFDLFHSLISHPLVDDSSLDWTDSILIDAIDLGLLTPESAIQNAKSLIEVLPQEGKTAAHIATLLTAKGETDGAVYYWDLAIAAVNEEDIDEKSLFVFGKADTLEQGGRHDEALWTLVVENWKATLVRQTAYESRLERLSERRQGEGIPEDPIALTVMRINEGDNSNLAWSALAALYEQRGDQRRDEDNVAEAAKDYLLAYAIISKLSQNDASLVDLNVPAFTKFIDTQISLGEMSAPTTLVAESSEWRFFDEGTDLGDEWRAPDFDDGDWKTGKGKFGYGGKFATPVSYGEKSSWKHVTTYFRHEFDLADDSAVSEQLRLRLLRDDGAVVYLNGEEILRDNMPEGEITYDTRATVSTTGADDDHYFEFLIESDKVRAGRNVIAVEVHQRQQYTPDLGFDLSLTGVTMTREMLASESADRVTGASDGRVDVPAGLISWLGE